jgi:hypothetical protein
MAEIPTTAFVIGDLANPPELYAPLRQLVHLAPVHWWEGIPLLSSLSSIFSISV